MGLFVPATNLQAFLKVGILGFQGSGKTFTGVDIAIGLHPYIKSTKPVMFLDTETGSDWALPRFQEAGIELLVAKTRAFKDLVQAFSEADGTADILIIDSVSHYWRELLESFKRSRHISGRIAFHHWQPIKAEWQKFSDAFVNSALHVIVCGRAAWEYDYQEDEEGKKDLIKTGTRMRAEGEFGYEPSLVIEMERVRESTTLEGKPVGKIGARVLHRAHVLKDRRMDGASMDGASIDNPTFDDFLPHVEALNLGGRHLGVDASRTSDDYFDRPDRSRTEERRQRQIALEELEQTCTKLWPGQTRQEKQLKIAVIEQLCGTKSWTAIKSMPLFDLQVAVEALQALDARAPEEMLMDKDDVLALLAECRRQVDSAVTDGELGALLGEGEAEAPSKDSQQPPAEPASAPDEDDQGAPPASVTPEEQEEAEPTPPKVHMGGAP